MLGSEYQAHATLASLASNAMHNSVLAESYSEYYPIHLISIFIRGQSRLAQLFM